MWRFLALTRPITPRSPQRCCLGSAAHVALRDVDLPRIVSVTATTAPLTPAMIPPLVGQTPSCGETTERARREGLLREECGAPSRRRLMVGRILDARPRRRPRTSPVPAVR